MSTCLQFVAMWYQDPLRPHSSSSTKWGIIPLFTPNDKAGHARLVGFACKVGWTFQTLEVAFFVCRSPLLLATNVFSRLLLQPRVTFKKKTRAKQGALLFEFVCTFLFLHTCEYLQILYTNFFLELAIFVLEWLPNLDPSLVSWTKQKINKKLFM